MIFRLVRSEKMGCMRVALLVVCLAGLWELGQAADKVQLGFYSESLCPDCIALANGPLEKAMNEARREKERGREKHYLSKLAALPFRLATFSR